MNANIFLAGIWILFSSGTSVHKAEQLKDTPHYKREQYVQYTHAQIDSISGVNDSLRAIIHVNDFIIERQQKRADTTVIPTTK